MNHSQLTQMLCLQKCESAEKWSNGFNDKSLQWICHCLVAIWTSHTWDNEWIQSHTMVFWYVVYLGCEGRVYIYEDKVTQAKTW